MTFSVGHTGPADPRSPLRELRARESSLVSCIHGDECEGTDVTRRLARGRGSAEARPWIVHNLNPDGRRLGIRLNGRGVDLNRNFGSEWIPIGRRWDPVLGPAAVVRAGDSACPPADQACPARRHDLVSPAAGPGPRLEQKQGEGPPLRAAAHEPYRSIRWPHGTAPNWQNHRFPGSASFVVELPAGRLAGRGRTPRPGRQAPPGTLLAWGRWGGVGRGRPACPRRSTGRAALAPRAGERGLAREGRRRASRNRLRGVREGSTSRRGRSQGEGGAPPRPRDSSRTQASPGSVRRHGTRQGPAVTCAWTDRGAARIVGTRWRARAATSAPGCAAPRLGRPPISRPSRAHWPRAHRAAYLVVHDAAGAEDIAQEAFVAAARPRPLRQQAAVRSLAAPDRGQPGDRLGAGTGTPPEVGAGEAIEDAAAEERGDPTAPLSEDVVAALASLSPDHRAVVVLRYVLEYTPGEIARMRELPRGTVNSRLAAGSTPCRPLSSHRRHDERASVRDALQTVSVPEELGPKTGMGSRSRCLCRA